MPQSADMRRSPRRRAGIAREACSTLAAAVGFCLVVIAGYYVANPDFFILNDARSEFLPGAYEVARLTADGQWPVLTTRIMSGGNQLVAFGRGPFDLLNNVVWSSWHVVGTPSRVGFVMVGALSVWMYIAGYVLARAGFGLARLASHMTGALVVTAPMFLVFTLPAWWNNGLGVAAYTWATAALLLAWRRSTWFSTVFLGVATVGVFTSGWPISYIAFAVTCVVVGVAAIRDAAPGIATRARAVLNLALPVVFGAIAAFPTMSEYLAVSDHLARSTASNNLHNQFVPSVGVLLGAANPVAGDFFSRWGYLYSPVSFGFATLLVLVAVFFTKHQVSLWRSDRLLQIIAANAAVFYVATQLPRQIGPTRWPMRYLGYAVVFVIAGSIYYIAKSERVWTIRRFLLATGVVAIGSLYASWRVPMPVDDRLRSLWLPLAAFISITTLLALYRLPRLRTHSAVALVACGIILSWAMRPAFQSPDLAFPTKAESQRLVETARGGFVLDAFSSGRTGWVPAAMSSRYALIDVSVVNGHDAVGHAAFGALVGQQLNGTLTPDVIDRLTTSPPSWPDVCWTDAMRVTVIVTDADPTAGRHSAAARCGFENDGTEGNTAALRHARHFADPRSTVSVATGNIELSDDVLVTERSERVSIVNDSANAGRVAFARLYWPGYSATLDGQPLRVTSLDEVLVEVEIPPHAAGELTLTYTPTTWRVAPYVVGVGTAGVVLVAFLLHRTSNQPRRKRAVAAAVHAGP